jgi:hypothetical protein
VDLAITSLGIVRGVGNGVCFYGALARVGPCSSPDQLTCEDRFCLCAAVVNEVGACGLKTTARNLSTVDGEKLVQAVSVVLAGPGSSLGPVVVWLFRPPQVWAR